MKIKRIVTVFLITVLLASSFNISFANNEEVTWEEFSELLEDAIGYNTYEVIRYGIETEVEGKTLEKGWAERFLEDREPKDSISRFEVAVILDYALLKTGENRVDNWKDYINVVKDYYTIPSVNHYKPYKYRGGIYTGLSSEERQKFEEKEDWDVGTTSDVREVLNIYAKGILSGYPDGTYRPNKPLTKNESEIIIERLVNKSKRKKIARLETYKNWIEPDLYLRYEEDGSFGTGYFSIGTRNGKELEEYSDNKYTFKIKNLTHPFLERYKTVDIFNPNEILIIDNSEGYITNGYGMYYSLSRLREEGPLAQKDIETNKPIRELIEEGEIITYKVTVSNGEITKEYMLNVEFRDREFN